VNGRNQYSIKLIVTRGHIFGRGRTIQNPKPGEDGEEKEKLLTAICQASETSEWKGSVGKEVAAGVDDRAGQEGKKSQQGKKRARLFGAHFWRNNRWRTRTPEKPRSAPARAPGQVLHQVLILHYPAQAGRGTSMLYCRVLAAPPQAPHSSDLRAA
jgi:hypothetical protein